MPSESLLLAVALGPLALGAALTAALLLWGVWPELSAAWERAGLPRLPVVWPVPLERVEATPDHDHDHLKEAA